MKQKKTPSLDTLKNQLKSLVPGGGLRSFQKFSVSMLKRLQMVIKNKGNMTKY